MRTIGSNSVGVEPNFKQFKQTNNMKRLLILTSLALILANCELSVRKAHADYSYRSDDTDYIRVQDVYYSEMHYKVYHTGLRKYMTTFVINITKDSLQCIYYKNHQFKD